jgi:hemerythrin-like domain-containing protein
MAALIHVLRREHENIAKLLDVLGRELAACDAGEQPDYEIIEAIASYFVGFPDQCHHPKEDLILEKMKGYEHGWGRAIVDLEAEHRDLWRLARVISQAVRNVLNEAEVPRLAFHHVVANFVDQQRRHMKFEEEVLFPAALEVLSPIDWAEIERQAGEASDPLFGNGINSEFEDLRLRVLAWERENQTTARDRDAPRR